MYSGNDMQFEKQNNAPYKHGAVITQTEQLVNEADSVNESINESVEAALHSDCKDKKPPLYVEDSGPSFYKVTGKLVTPMIITKNLPEYFNSLPIYGRPESKDKLPDFYKNKLRDYIGYDLNDEEFRKLSSYCSPNHLRTGHEVQMTTNFPTHGGFPAVDKMNEKRIIEEGAKLAPTLNLSIIKKYHQRTQLDTKNVYVKKLKYRGMRMIPLSMIEEDKSTPTQSIERPLEPGRDLLFRIRIYRPFCHDRTLYKVRNRGRHSLLCCDLVLLGRQPLSVLRDRIVCSNDLGVRFDVAARPNNLPDTSSRDLFPAGFLFINNVFYTDRRRECTDLSASVREWARARGLGDFPCEDLASVRLDQLRIKLGHPEVYAHQGACEHLFTFSELRLAGAADPARALPASTCVSRHQTVYCTTCAEFGAKWIVEGCARVPFDPAFLCDTCFKLYLYDEEDRPLADFRAYSYMGNELNMLRPQT